ncbi:MAG TPA: DUF1330 domain-containing protein [Burkholderiales bacterium]|nr:DUF1330 domain-containing protein [Burkholderiales bacterium]
MNARYTVLAAAVAGFAAGAVTIEQLHAQAKPPVFYVAEIDMKNAEAYQKEYAPKAQATIKKHGGKLLAAGQNITAFDGAPPKSRVAIQQWESIEKIQAWRNSAEYKEARKIGDKYATFRSFAIAGLPQP